MRFAAVVHSVVNCLVPTLRNKRCAPRNTSLLYTMSNRNLPNLRFPEPLHLIQFICRFVTGNALENLIEAWGRVIQDVYDSAMRGLEKCVPLFFLFFICRRFSSTEKDINIAVFSGDYPHIRDKVRRLSQLGARYVVLLVAICVLGKILVCFFFHLLARNVC